MMCSSTTNYRPNKTTLVLSITKASYVERKASMEKAKDLTKDATVRLNAKKENEKMEKAIAEIEDLKKCESIDEGN